MSIDLTDILAEEEAKSGRTWSPVERWRKIEELIGRFDAQAEVPRNSREGSRRKEAFLLAGLMKEVPRA